MKIIVLDDEELAIKRLQKSILEVKPDAEILTFYSAKEVYHYALEHKIDIAFLDICGLDMDGITLAKKLKEINPRINVIFSTGYGDYALDALEMYVSGYLMKPITAAKVRKALSELRYPIEQKQNNVRVQCFGNFEIFVNQKPLTFQYSKTKELIAYLFDRKGALCTIGEIMATLWEDDDDHYSYIKQLRKDFYHTLRENNLEDLIVKQRGSLGIVYDAIDSDLKNWENGNTAGGNTFQGEYMSQYSWAEETAALLTRRLME